MFAISRCDYSLTRYQYKKPVFMNDVLDAEIRVEEVFESVNTVELKFTFRNQYSQVVSKGHVQIGVI